MVFLALLGGTYLALQNSRVQTFVTQILARQLSKQINSKISIGKVNIAFFNKIILEDVLLEGQQNDTIFYTQRLSASLDSLRYRKKKIFINQFSFEQSKINIERDSLNHFNFSFILDSLRSPQKDTTALWQIKCNKFAFHQSNFTYKDIYTQKQDQFFIHDINFDISDFYQQQDSIRFAINQLTLNDGKHLYLNRLNAEVTYTKNKVDIKNVNLASNLSEINNAEFIIDLKDSKNRQTKFDARFSDSKISFYEIAELVPALKGMEQIVNCSGQVYGTINDLKGKNIILKTGKKTTAMFDFYINDLKTPENMYLFVDLKQSESSFSDISEIKLPLQMPFSHFSFPDAFYNAGQLSYKGNFSGFLTDFVTFGTFSSKMGILTTDVSVVPNANGNISYRGKIKTTNFKLGKLFQSDLLGNLTFNGNVDGTFNRKKNTLNGQFIGDISTLEINHYTYQNIKLNGTLDNKMFDGLLSVNDPNLKFNFSGKVDLNNTIPGFDFNLELQEAFPGKLNLSKNFPNSKMAFNMQANFTGDKIDNLKGSILIQDGNYKNRNGKLNLHGLELKSSPGDSINTIRFSSDFLDIDILGKYDFQTIVNAIKKSANRYLPAISYEKMASAKDNNFKYQINVKNLDDVMTVFMPEYKIETPFVLYGKLNAANAEFNLEGSIPGIGNEKFWLKDIFIGNKPINDEYASKFRIGEVALKNGLKLYNVSIDSKLYDNEIDNQITWTNFHDLTYSGTLKTHAVLEKSDSKHYPHIEITGSPSSIFIADSVWQIEPFAASIDSSTIQINNFKFHNEEQEIAINGKIGKDKSNILSMRFSNLNLANIGPYLNEEVGIRGILNGSAGLIDFYSRRMIYSDLSINGFAYEAQEIGDVSLTNQWDNHRSVLNSRLIISKNNRQSLNATGTYNPETNELNYDANLDHLSLVILETIIRNNFSNIHGDATGKIKVHGTPKKILLTGAVEGSNAGLTIDYTQVTYNFTDTVYFKGDTIDFANITIYDVNKNRGTFDGTIVHDNFEHMIYNLSLSSPKILAMNTTSKNNEQFFGQIIANGKLDITGYGKSVNLDGSGTTLQGTNVNISLDYESNIEQYDFIQFTNPQKEEIKEFVFPTKYNDDFNLNLTIHATPEARVQLIYNSQIGDVIRAQGDGLLMMGMDKEGNVTLSGNYTVDRGDYLFTLENVINKRFSIEQGGTLVWSGDPYNASVNLNAIYKLKASLYDLLTDYTTDINQTQRIPVECKIKLTEELSNPNIKFEIDFPSADEQITDLIRQYFNSEEDLNKQMLSLLVLGKFYTPEYMRGTYEAQNPNLIGTTASELFSNQLSNWLSQISNNVDVGLNYRPGNQITNDEIELALSTQMFNDRVTLNGNIGNNVNPTSTNNSQLVGDFDINVKLIPSGKIQLKAYNHSNNSLIYETAPYTQGVGFIFKEEYNTFKELLRKITSIFKRKKKTKD